MKKTPPYTEEEKKKLKDGRWTSNCHVCGHHWLRDYSFPVRNCPACGALKPWADKELAA